MIGYHPPELIISTVQRNKGQSRLNSSVKMGQITPAHVILALAVLLVNGSIQDKGYEPTENLKESFVKKIPEEVDLLCEELEEEKYSLNKTLFKLRVLPVERWWSQEKVSRLWSVGFFSSSLKMSDEQLIDLLTPQWIEDEFEKEQKKKGEKKKIVIPQKALQVNALGKPTGFHISYSEMLKLCPYMALIWQYGG